MSDRAQRGVCVIIPAYRAQATVARAIRSVAQQTHRAARIVVVDDGSDDGTARAARDALDAVTGVETVLLVERHGGAGAARNAGLRAARESIVAFLDADDEWLPNKLARSLAAMSATSANFVSHDYLRISADGGASTVSCASLFVPGVDNYHALYRKGFIATSTVVCERRLLTAAGSFDETLPNAQDFDLWLRVLAVPGARLHVFAEALCRYHVMAGSVTQSTDRRLASCTRVALRHFDALGSRSGNPWSSLWYRIAAIHWEALQAHGSRGHWHRALGTAAAFPGRLALATLAAGEDQTRPPRRLGWLLTAWVVGALVVYLAQFRELIGPVLTAFGVG